MGFQKRKQCLLLKARTSPESQSSKMACTSRPMIALSLSSSLVRYNCSTKVQTSSIRKEHWNQRLNKWQPRDPKSRISLLKVSQNKIYSSKRPLGFQEGSKRGRRTVNALIMLRYLRSLPRGSAMTLSKKLRRSCYLNQRSHSIQSVSLRREIKNNLTFSSLEPASEPWMNSTRRSSKRGSLTTIRRTVSPPSRKPRWIKPSRTSSKIRLELKFWTTII